MDLRLGVFSQTVKKRLNNERVPNQKKAPEEKSCDAGSIGGDRGNGNIISSRVGKGWFTGTGKELPVTSKEGPGTLKTTCERVEN